MTNNEIIEIFNKEANSKSRKYSDCTKRTYLTYIEKYLNSLNKDVADTTERDIRLFLSSYETKSDKLYNTVLDSLNALYNILESTCLLPENYITKNPCKHIKRVAKPKMKEKKSISNEDFQAMLRACKNNRDTAILTFFMATGVRNNELMNVKYEDYINYDEDKGLLLTVTKGSKERTIYLNKDVINAVNDYLKDRKNTCEYLFVSNYGNQMSASCIYRTIKTIANRAGLDEDVIDNLSPHSARHSYITNLINKGINIATIATIVGHQSPAVTLKYVDRSKLDVKSAMCM
jgi:site-specific recombinase XerD